MTQSSRTAFASHTFFRVSILFVFASIYLLCIIATHGWQESLQLLTRGFPNVGSSSAFPQRPVPTTAHPDELPVRSLSNFPPLFILHSKNNPKVNLDQYLKDTGTHAFVIVRNDHIIYEKYFHGSNRRSLQLSFSMAKSFMSTLIGVAINEGKIHSVYDPVVSYIPELKGRGLDTLTIRDLMTMSSGIPFKNSDVFPLLAPFTDDAKLFYTSDARRKALSVRSGSDPVGKYFLYNDYHPLLEGIILERVTGKSISEYLSAKIWQPLGMTAPASWNLDHAPQGMEKTEDGLNARAIDFARFGLLFLHHGQWNGKQLVPESWVNEATSFNAADHRPWQVSAFWPAQGGFYKYHWWGIHRPPAPDDYFALGHLGQLLFVSPSHNAVVVRLGGSSSLSPEWPFIIRDILNQLPPKE